MIRKSTPTIADLIVAIKDRRLAQDFLQDILTPAERDELESRWKLVCLLAQGVSQREVARRLKLSLCKITRGSRELRYGKGSFKALIGKWWPAEKGRLKR